MITTASPTSDRASDVRQLKIAFINPVNLFDPGNGAATSVRTMLEQLAKLGASCHVLTACCFDVPPEDLTSALSCRGLAPSGRIAEFDIPVWQGKVDGVSYDAVALSTQKRAQLTATEEVIFRDTARVWLEQCHPNIVITFGGLLLDIEIQRCAKVAGAAVVFYLANPHYTRRETFADVDLILTNSVANAGHYATLLDLQCQSVGVFVDVVPIVTSRPDPRFITFVNPLPEKGVTLFLKLVQKASQTAADMRFLVVESRGMLADAMRKLNLPDGILDNVTVLPKQDQMAEVYAQTKILLMPSFWFEAAGRVLIEANANGIPVIASDRGGIPETLGEAGRILPIPEQCTRDHWAIPTDDETAPWWDELSKLWRASAYYQMQARKALVVAQTSDLEGKTAKLANLLLSLIEMR
jgi:glycosyltransferase involved in cell wall biosynthesis